MFRLHLTGKGRGGLLVDSEGISDPTNDSLDARINWEEVTSVFPLDRSFLGIVKDRSRIGFTVTDDYLNRKTSLTRLLVWWNRRFSRSGDLQLSSRALKGTRDELLRVFEESLSRHELRALMEAKQIEANTGDSTGRLDRAALDEGEPESGPPVSGPKP